MLCKDLKIVYSKNHKKATNVVQYVGTMQLYLLLK